jgi:RHS repeat-associated protein
VTYTYDGDGKRVKKSSGTLYWYGMGADAIDETDSTGSTSNSTFNEYVFFEGKRVARRNSSNTAFYYFADHLGTSRVMVQSGQTSACYDADFYPFGGERAPITNSCPQNYKFSGKERDAESGLDDFVARYYGNAVGRFSSPDSFLNDSHVSEPQSWNEYAYARNNPLRYIDPNGQKADVSVTCNSDQTACQVDIHASIAVYAESGSDISAGQLKQAGSDIKSQIESAWSGTYQQAGVTYNITTTVDIQVASDESSALKSGAQNVIALKDGDAVPGDKSSLVYRSSVFGGPDRGVWNINDMRTTDMPAHEFTHLLGVGDREAGDSISNHWNDTPKANSQDFKWALSGTLWRDQMIRQNVRIEPEKPTQETVGAPTRFGWWK